VVRSRRVQVPTALTGALLLALFLAVHIHKDLTAPVGAWYFHSTWVWLAVMLVATLVYLRETVRLRRRGVDLHAVFAALPPE
jgi:APA family basic amino acid/polyamine antiporter